MEKLYEYILQLTFRTLFYFVIREYLANFIFYVCKNTYFIKYFKF